MRTGGIRTRGVDRWICTGPSGVDVDVVDVADVDVAFDGDWNVDTYRSGEVVCREEMEDMECVVERWGMGVSDGEWDARYICKGVAVMEPRGAGVMVGVLLYRSANAGNGGGPFRVIACGA